MFCPTVLHPTPDPHFVRELAKLDPDLRVVWGFDQYLLNKWVIERRLSPEAYYQHYRSLIDEHQGRFVQQPIFDTGQPEYTEEGDEVGYRVVGYRRYDLAPEWEYVMTVQESDNGYRPLDSRTLLELRRVYAWERFHSLTRARLEKQREQEEAEAKQKRRRVNELLDEIMAHKREIWQLPFSGQPQRVAEGTEL